MSPESEHDEIIAGFLSLVGHYGLSVDKPQDGWNLAFALYMDVLRRRKVGASRATTRKASGRKTTVGMLARDAVTMLGVHIARRDGDRRGEERIIRDLASANGWPADDAAVKTLWRRHMNLKDPASPERQRLAKALREDPSITAALMQQPEKK